MGTERKKIIEKEIMEYVLQTAENQMETLEKIMEEQKEQILTGLLGVFHRLFLQAKQEEKEAAYIVLSFLNSSLLNERIEMRIDIYGSEMYFDETPITGYYEFQCFEEMLVQDFEAFRRYIEKKIIRVKYHELWQYRQVCMIKYKSLIESCMAVYVELIVKLRSFMQMEKTGDLKIVYGEYLCKNIVLYESVGK